MTLVDVAKAAAKLKDLKRQGWIEKLSITDGESVADHSYVTALISMMLSDTIQSNTERAIKMALLHDLAEAKIGDVVPGQMPDKQKEKIETDAFFEIVSVLPDDLKSEYAEIWGEFCAGKTAEAKLVRQADKIDMALQAVLYEKGGRATKKGIAAFLSTADHAITDTHAKDLLSEITSEMNHKKDEYPAPEDIAEIKNASQKI